MTKSKMDVRTRCYFAVLKKFKQQYSDAHFELIMRRFHHILSPSWSLVKKIKDEKMEWNEYVAQFLEEIYRPEAIDAVMELIEVARKKTLFLVCFEKDATNCHRSIVKWIMKQVERNGMQFPPIRELLKKANYFLEDADERSTPSGIDKYFR